jgi:photosystem II stability/assembly factor-like uncharacterized protein
MMNRLQPSIILDVAILEAGLDSFFVLAASDTGIWRSLDLGKSWRQLIGETVATTIAVSPEAAQHRMIFAGLHGAIARSTDGGDHWTIGILPQPAPAIASFAFSPGFADDGLVLAATMEDGLFVSADYGHTWARSTIGLFDPRLIHVTMTDKRTALVVAESGLFTSHDSCRSWVEKSGIDSLAPFTTLGSLRDTVAIGTESNGFLLSFDASENWQPRGDVSFARPVVCIRMIAMRDKSGVMVVMESSALVLYRIKTDSLSFWKEIPLPDGATCVDALNVHNQKLVILVAFDHGSIKAYDLYFDTVLEQDPLPPIGGAF